MKNNLLQKKVNINYLPGRGQYDARDEVVSIESATKPKVINGEKSDI
jgi:hypothetical protein